MKKNLFLFLFMVLIATFARAEKTYVKDSTECTFQGEKILLELRSENLITDSEDDYFGETISIRHNGKTSVVQALDIPGRYRFFRQASDYCNKALSLNINLHTIAIFLAKDNRPFADNLMVLYYNTKSGASDIVATKITTNEGFAHGSKTFFRLASDNCTEKMGHVLIDNERYTWIEKTIEPWVSFDGKNFRLDQNMTFEKFHHKHLLKRTDLNGLSAFKEMKYKIASQSKTGKTCLSVNNDEWKCR